MNNILIITLGQRDLQIVHKNEYDSFEKSSQREIHNKLKVLLDNKQLEWLPKTLLDKEKGQSKEISDIDVSENGIKMITFPLIETLFSYFNENELDINKMYIFYTDRTNTEGVNKKFLDKEPYLTHYFFKYFQKEITKKYNISVNNGIEYLNIGENIPDLNNYSKLYVFFDENIKKFQQNKLNKVYVATAGGIPPVRNVIEDLITLYYPQNSVILEQGNGKVEQSKFHYYKNYYRNYNLLKNSIKEWDFAKAMKTYQKMVSSKKSLIYKLLKTINEIFFENEYVAKNTIKKLIKDKKCPNKYKKDLQSIFKVLKNRDNNISFITFLKFLQTYKQGNYWASSTILITLFEIFIEDTLVFYYPDCIYIDKQNNEIRKYFDWKKINPNWNPKSVKRNYNIFSRKHSEYLNNNWASIEEILLRILPRDKEDIFIFINKNLLSRARSFKVNRNNFVHHGFGINKKDIDKLLEIENSNNDFMGSYILSEIFKELKKHNENYFNWLEFFENILLEEIKTLEPNIKYKNDK